MATAMPWQARSLRRFVDNQLKLGSGIVEAGSKPTDQRTYRLLVSRDRQVSLFSAEGWLIYQNAPLRTQVGPWWTAQPLDFPGPRTSVPEHRSAKGSVVFLAGVSVDPKR